MKWKYWLPIPLLSALVLVATAPKVSASRITASSGDVRIKKTSYRDFQPASVGTSLTTSDLIQVRNGASAIITCNSGSQWQVPVGEYQVSIGCPNDSTTRTRSSSIRGSENENIPYLIGYRNTAVLPGQPLTLTWNPIAGATSYKVVILDGAQPIWETRVTEPRAVFSGTDTWQREWAYSVVITASNGVKAPEGTGAPPVISVVSDETARTVDDGLTTLNAADMEGDALALAVADLYRENGLLQDALNTLDAAIQSGTQSPAVYHLQGELYQQMELQRQAKESYLQALDLAKATGDIALQANLQEQLGRLAYNLEDYAQAVAWLQAAEKNYQTFLDTTNPDVQEDLNDLADLIEDSQARVP